MSLPGFTAEGSLYKTSKSYRLAAKETVITDGQAIIPQWDTWQCSPNGCLCLHCFYNDYTGQLIYCDVYGPYC